MTAVFRVETDALVDLDRHLVQLPCVSLTRSDAGLFIECADELADLVSVLVARAGARATRGGTASRTADLVPALACDLAPLALGGLVDRVTIRRVATSEATARLASASHGPFRRRRPPDDRIRHVLRGEDRLYAWRRVVWAKGALMRAGALRGVRPIVFDRGAIANGGERLSRAGAGELTRWARG